jgi:peroxiredoxin
MDNLKQQVTALREELDEAMSDDVRRLQERSIHRVEDSGQLDSAATVGDHFPQFSLPNAGGNAVSSEELLAKGPLVVCFYRGGWCPYCRLELRAYQAVLSDIRELGADFIAISPQQPDESLATAAKTGLHFEVLSDTGNSLAEHLGLAFELPSAMIDLYRSSGFDLERINGNLRWTLPVPATYVVGTDGIIIDAFVQADYTIRREPEEVLAALRGL